MLALRRRAYPSADSAIKPAFPFRSVFGDRFTAPGVPAKMAPACAVGVGMLTRSDLFDKAAECESRMRLAADPAKQTAFRLLRDMWIMLANASDDLRFHDLSDEISAIEQIQTVAEKETLQ
jgi:hypothetical protein